MIKDSHESYAHHTAKTIFAGWLRTAAENAGYDEYANFAGIEWRVNRPSPLWGVYEEYPLLHDDSVVWDEQGYAIPPTYKEMKKNFKGDFKIADIVVQHKGSIIYVIEIVHKNALSQEKEDFYNSMLVRPKIIVIPTHWILGQIGIPQSIPREFFV